MIFDKETLQALLNLPDIAIDRVVLGERKMLKIDVHSTLKGTHCHRCGQPIDYDYGPEIKLRHLPFGEYRVVLLIRLKRYQCHSCEGHPTTSQTLPDFCDIFLDNDRNQAMEYGGHAVLF